MHVCVIAPIALVVNPLLLVPIAWALYGGLGVLIFGWFLPPVANLFGRFCEINLAWIEWMIGTAQQIPGSHLWTSGPSLTSLIVFYTALFFTAVFPPTKLPLKWIAVLGLAWLVFGWLVPNQFASMAKRNGGEELTCTFVDVGHGTSVLVQFPDGKNLLYDAGSFGSPEYGSRNICGALWHERIDHLDALVISHGDIDHFNSLPEICQKFTIGVAYVSPQMLESRSQAVESILRTLHHQGVSVMELAAGDRLVSGAETKVSVLNPPEFGTGGNDNSDSIVLLIEHAGSKILLPGDLESFGLERLMRTKALDCDLVMAPHHGSSNSQPEAFMNWTTPECVVISGGSQRVKTTTVRRFENRGRLTQQKNSGSLGVKYQTLQAQTPDDQPRRVVLRTDRDGAIRYVVGSDRKSVWHWDGDDWNSISMNSDN